jgi:hypothetical protein
MAHSELCPVCKGSGVFDGRTCHGCGGSGWVTVHDGVKYAPPICPKWPPDYPAYPTYPTWPYYPYITCKTEA